MPKLVVLDRDAEIATGKPLWASENGSQVRSGRRSIALSGFAGKIADAADHMDADCAFDKGFRVVQFTPPGSPASVQFGTNITSAEPARHEVL
jgi:hypothetical protein